MAETLKDLTNELRDTHREIEILCDFDFDSEDAEKAIASLMSRIKKKTEAIDNIVTGFEIADGRIDMAIDVLNNEIKHMKARSEAIKKNKDRLIQYLGEVGLVTKDNPLRTSAHTYFVQTTSGAVEIEDDSIIPDKYLKTKIEQVIDKASLRKDIIDGTVYIDGVTVPKKTRVSRR